MAITGTESLQGYACAVVRVRHALRVTDNPLLLAAQQTGLPVLLWDVVAPDEPRDTPRAGRYQAALSRFAVECAAIGLQVAQAKGDVLELAKKLQGSLGPLLWLQAEARSSQEAHEAALLHELVAAGGGQLTLVADNRLIKPEHLPFEPAQTPLEHRELVPTVWRKLHIPPPLGRPSVMPSASQQAIEAVNGQLVSPAEAAGTLSEAEQLAMGCVSARELYQQAAWREILRHREHAFMLREGYGENLLHPGGLLTLPIAWQQSAAHFDAWQRGQTGVPIVDAIQRKMNAEHALSSPELRVSAHFFLKNLRLPWQVGAAWFLQQLPALESPVNLQFWLHEANLLKTHRWAYRYLDPRVQSRRLDPNGTFIRYWVPELTRFGSETIHEPWQTSRKTQQQKDCLIGEAYPDPIVNIAASLAEHAAHFAQVQRAERLKQGKPLIRRFVPTARERAKTKRTS